MKRHSHQKPAVAHIERNHTESGTSTETSLHGNWTSNPLAVRRQTPLHHKCTLFTSCWKNNNNILSTSPVRAWGGSKPGSLCFHKPQRRRTKIKWHLPWMRSSTACVTVSVIFVQAFFFIIIIFLHLHVKQNNQLFSRNVSSDADGPCCTELFVPSTKLVWHQ